MEVLALVSAAASFNVVHADDDRVLAAVHHASLQRMSVATVALAPRAVPALEFPTNLGERSSLLVNICLFIIPIHRTAVFRLHTSSLSVRVCLCEEVPLDMAARPVGLPGTSRGVLGSSSGIRPIPGPMWFKYGLKAILGLVARECVIGNVV